jgi:hypothetical protein
VTEKWRVAFLDWIESQKQLETREIFSEQQRSEILSCLPVGADGASGDPFYSLIAVSDKITNLADCLSAITSVA